MATYRTILKNEDIKEYGLLGSNFATCKLKSLKDIELHEFRCKLGVDFYSFLLDHLNDYSSAIKWDPSKADYAQNEAVIYQGIFWVAINANPTAGSTPNEKDGLWKLAPKFDTECLESLWCQYLGVYLANTAIFRLSKNVSIEFKDVGFIRRRGSDYDPASVAEIDDAVHSIGKMVEIEFDNLDWYLKEEKDNCEGFDLYLGNSCNVCNLTPCNCGSGNCGSLSNEYIFF